MAALKAMKNILGEHPMDIIYSYLHSESQSATCGTGASDVGNISEFDFFDPFPPRSDCLYLDSLELASTRIHSPSRW